MKSPLIDELKIRLQYELPGKVAQQQMSPSRRFPFMHNPNVLQSKVGAVMILLYKKENMWHFPIIVRPTYNGAHSGQLSLPGGKMEQFDNGLSETALRETQEEIGIDKSDIEVIGKLSTIYIPKSNYIVHPYVGYLSTIPNFIADEIEVDKILEFPLAVLADDSYKGHYHFSMNELKIIAPCWNIEGYQLWGATAMILAEFVSVIESV